MLDFCIIGSGVSGSTIAHILSRKYNVEIFDKARGLGGRASNKRFFKKQSFDHGVQYISPRSKEFEKFIQFLYKKKVSTKKTRQKELAKINIFPRYIWSRKSWSKKF